MDINEINELEHGFEEAEIIVEPVAQEQDTKPFVVGAERDLIKHAAPEIAKQLSEEKYRQIALWVKNNNYGLNCLERLNEVAVRKIFYRLMRGWSESKAIRGYCTWPTWCKLKDSDPEVKSIIEAAVNYRKERLEQEMYSIADQKDRTRVGEVARDKLMIDVRDREIARLEGVTSKLDKDRNGTPIVPIQFNLNLVSSKKKV